MKNNKLQTWGRTMNFRRSEFDVTQPDQHDRSGLREARSRAHLPRRSTRRACLPRSNRAFDDIVRLYRGENPGYATCDTAYHDLQHVLEVTLAMARLLDGYERSRGDGAAPSASGSSSSA